MSQVNNNVDAASVLNNYTKQDWTNFLAERAYRGYKINRFAKKSDSSTYDKASHQLQFVSKGGTIKTINMTELLEAKSWSFARLCHNIKMKCSDAYAEKFNTRIANLAELITNAQEPLDQPELETLPLPEVEVETLPLPLPEVEVETLPLTLPEVEVETLPLPLPEVEVETLPLPEPVLRPLPPPVIPNPVDQLAEIRARSRNLKKVEQVPLPKEKEKTKADSPFYDEDVIAKIKKIQDAFNPVDQNDQNSDWAVSDT